MTPPTTEHRDPGMREAHLRGVVCEGWVERADGRWEAKGC